MSRKAHSCELVKRAHELRASKPRPSYRKIAVILYAEFKIEVGDMTIRDWTTYRTRGP